MIPDSILAVINFLKLQGYLCPSFQPEACLVNKYLPGQKLGLQNGLYSASYLGVPDRAEVRVNDVLFEYFSHMDTWVGTNGIGYTLSSNSEIRLQKYLDLTFQWLNENQLPKTGSDIC